MKRVQIDESLIQQIDLCDLFPRGKWSRRAKVDYLVRIGLAILLHNFKQQTEAHPATEQPKDELRDFIAQMSIARVLESAEQMKLPKSEVARLLNRSLYDQTGTG